MDEVSRFQDHLADMTPLPTRLGSCHGGLRIEIAWANKIQREINKTVNEQQI